MARPRAALRRRDGGSGVDPAEVSDPDEAARLLASSLTLIGESFNTTEIGAQFIGQRPARAATVKCATAGLLWGLDRAGFRTVQQHSAGHDATRVLRGVALLSPFAPCDGSFDLADIAFELSVNGQVKQSGHVEQARLRPTCTVMRPQRTQGCTLQCTLHVYHARPSRAPT